MRQLLFIAESAPFLFTVVGTVLENKLFPCVFLPALSRVLIELLRALLASPHAIAGWCPDPKDNQWGSRTT